MFGGEDEISLGQAEFGVPTERSQEATVGLELKRGVSGRG